MIARVVDAPLPVPVPVPVPEHAVADKAPGALVSFATHVITALAEGFATPPDVHAVAMSRRIGLLGIGDVALAWAASAAHRGQAFAACAELVDEVKKQLPICKRQVFTDGEEEWVASP